MAPLEPDREFGLDDLVAQQRAQLRFMALLLLLLVAYFVGKAWLAPPARDPVAPPSPAAGPAAPR